MKKLIAYILCVMMIFSLCACDSSTQLSTPDTVVEQYLTNLPAKCYAAQSAANETIESPIDWQAEINKGYKYEITSVIIDGKISLVYATITNRDLGTAFVEASGMYLTYVFGAAFNDPQPTDEEIEAKYAEFLQTSFDAATETVRLECVFELEMSKEGWILLNPEIDNMENIVTGNLFIGIQDFANSFGDVSEE